MDGALRLTILVLGIGFVVAVLFLLITRRINERAALPWIVGSLVIMVLSLVPHILTVLANATGVSYPPALLFLFSSLVILLLLMYQAIQISVLQEKCRELAQNLAIMRSTVLEPIRVDSDMYRAASGTETPDGKPVSF